MARDAFSSEMNWSTYQDKQLSVLISLERSFNTSLSVSKAVRDNLTDLQSAMTSMVNSANALANFVNGLSYSRSSGGGKKSSNARAAREAADRERRNQEEAHRIAMENARSIYEQNMEYLEDQVKAAREELEYALERKKTQEEYDRDHKAAVDLIVDKFIQALDYFGKIADNYLASSNNLTKVTGNSAAVVQSAKNEIVNDIVAQLNRETGNFYSYQDSYAKMVSVANEANVGNIEALKEMTRPILLADESLNANLGTIATLFNRFYTRYSFNSTEMEDIVDEIRGNTAGNSSTAQATLENISKLESLVSIYSGGDKDKMSEMVDSISTYTSYLESMGVDTANITSTMYDIMLGNKEALSPNVLAALHAAGSSFEEAQSLLRNDVDGMEKVVSIFTTGTEKLIGKVIDSPVAGQSMDALGVPKEYLDLYAAFNSPGFKSLEEFISDQSNKATAAETVEEMYISGTKQVTYWLEKISNGIADAQNRFGIGLTDIVQVLGMYFGIKKGAEILGKGFGKGVGGAGGGSAAVNTATMSNMLGSYSTTTGAGTGVAGALGKAGTALGSKATTAAGTVGAGAAGVAGGIAAAATIGSAVVDFVDAKTEATWRESEDKIAEGGIKLAGVGSGAAVGAAVGSIVPGLGTAVGALVGAGLGGVATLIWGDDWAQQVTDWADGTTKLKKTMGEITAAQKSLDESMKASQSFEELEKLYKDQLSEVKRLTPGTEDYDKALSGLEETISKFQSQYPGYIQLEQDELAIKEGSLEVVKQLTEAERQLAEVRKKDAISDSIENEDTLKKNKEKSKKKFESESQEEYDAAQALLDLYEKKLQPYKAELDKATEAAYYGETSVSTALKNMGASEGAIKAWEESKGLIRQYYKASGQDTAFDGTAWTQDDDYYANIVYNEGIPDIFSKVTGGYKAASKAYEDDTKAYDEAYLSNIRLLEQSLRQPFSDAAAEYHSMSSDLKYNFRENLGLLRDLNEEFSDLSTESIRIDHDALAKTAGITQYAVGTNYVTRDQIAMLHEGEAVVPKKYNPAANMNELEVLREQSESARSQSVRSSEETNELLGTLAESIGEIREFLAYWREDNIKRENINKVGQKYKASTSGVASYFV